MLTKLLAKWLSKYLLLVHATSRPFHTEQCASCDYICSNLTNQYAHHLNTGHLHKWEPISVRKHCVTVYLFGVYVKDIVWHEVIENYNEEN